MFPQLRQFLHAYAARRSPWGPPWWIYGVAFGAANLARQIVIIATTAEVPQSFRIASWVATALVVIIIVNSVAAALWRRDGDGREGSTRTLAPMWPLRRHVARRAQPTRSPASNDRTGNSSQVPTQATTSTKWAPWWAYLVIIVGANYLRRAIVTEGGGPAVGIIVALAVAAAVFIVITVVYRAIVRR
jgi:hypothetical protein